MTMRDRRAVPPATEANATSHFLRLGDGQSVSYLRAGVIPTIETDRHIPKPRLRRRGRNKPAGQASAPWLHLLRCPTAGNSQRMFPRRE